MDAVTIAQKVRDRAISASEVTEAHLKRIDQVNGKLNAIVRRMDDDARAAALKLDTDGVKGPMAGVAVTSKINTDHAGYPTDNGLVMLRDAVAAGTNATIQGLIDAGGVFVGRTNSPAMAMRFHTDNMVHGATKNPHDETVSPGGSSGGAGAAVATGMCVIAQGNDVGGSVRWPAFCNGIVGLRPSFGRMATIPTNVATPRPFGSELMATNGPLARTVADCRLAFQAMLTDSWDDPWYVPAPLEGPKIAGPIHVALVVNDGLPMHAATVNAVKTAGRHLADAGYIVEEVNPPGLDRVFTLWNRIGITELNSLFKPMLPVINDPGLTASMSAWLEIAPALSVDELLQALVERDLILRAWNQFFKKYPVIVTPSYTQPFMRANEDTEGIDAMRNLLLQGRYLLGLPPLGLPGLAVPVGRHGNMPQGVQIIARRFREDLCFAAGEEIERREGVRPVVDVSW